jgi:hypothetical protein
LPDSISSSCSFIDLVRSVDATLGTYLRIDCIISNPICVAGCAGSVLLPSFGDKLSLANRVAASLV